MEAGSSDTKEEGKMREKDEQEGGQKVTSDSREERGNVRVSDSDRLRLHTHTLLMF